MHSIDLRETEKPNLSGNSAKRRLRRVDFPTPLGPETTRGRKNSDIWQVCVDEGCVPGRKRKGESKHACISTEQPSPLCARRCPNCVYSVRAVIHSSVLSNDDDDDDPCALSCAFTRDVAALLHRPSLLPRRAFLPSFFHYGRAVLQTRGSLPLGLKHFVADPVPLIPFNQPVDFEGDVNLFHFVLLKSIGKGAFGKVDPSFISNTAIR